MKFGDVKICKWEEMGCNKKHYYFERDCEECPMGWDVTSYEGECEDCGCLFDYHFNTPIWKCLLSHKIKAIIKKIKKWED